MECPFLDQPLRPECSEVARIEHIDHALSYCCGDFQACPLFRVQVQMRHADRVRLRAASAANPAARAAMLAGGSFGEDLPRGVDAGDGGILETADVGITREPDAVSELTGQECGAVEVEGGCPVAARQYPV